MKDTVFVDLSFYSLFYSTNNRTINTIYLDYLNSMFYTYNVAIEFLKRYHYDYIRTNKSTMCENQY